MFALRRNLVCDVLQPLYGRPVAADRHRAYICEGSLTDEVKRIDEVIFERRQVADLEAHVQREGPVQNGGAIGAKASGAVVHFYMRFIKALFDHLVVKPADIVAVRG